MGQKASFETEVQSGDRFAFGDNWSRFLNTLDDSRIEAAHRSLKEWHKRESFEGSTFLDIGSGSGLFSLAARQMGAEVRSFDYDSQSVQCTMELKRKFFPEDASWSVDQGSVLDGEWMESLGQFDIVYSWGVLHHTGDMWHAIMNAQSRVAPNGYFHIALYNDQGWPSKWWTSYKRAFLKSPYPLNSMLLFLGFLRMWGPVTLKDLLKGRPGYTWRNYGRGENVSGRGMTPWYDVRDWIGGYPFEVSKPEEVFDYLQSKGFSLEKLRTCAGGKGCNEFIFKRTGDLK